MSASIQNPNEWAWPVAQLPVPLKLTSLDLAIIREGCLGKVLAVTPNLDTLRWDWYFDWGVHDRFITQTIDLDKIAIELSHVRGTLTDLTINATMGIAGDPVRPALKTEGSLHALVNFHLIKRLQVPWAFLVGFAQDRSKRLRDVIPENIEYLTITDDLAWQNDDRMEEDWPEWEWEDYVILDLLEAWLEGWKTYTPHLCGITVSLSWIDTDIEQWSSRIRDRLTGARAGVSLELIALEMLHNWPIQITPDTLPNPYDTLPSESYMQATMDAMKGGGPSIASPASFSGEATIRLAVIQVAAYDYSSVTLKWDISNRIPPYAYAVFQDGKEVVRMPGTMAQVTIGNIAPGSSKFFI
ncbi:hypothetical protein BJX99DRAFT_263916 [Aspergillus californicus]